MKNRRSKQSLTSTFVIGWLCSCHDSTAGGSSSGSSGTPAGTSSAAESSSTGERADESSSTVADESSSGSAVSCGDGVATAREECDDGVNDGSYGGCNADCTLAPRCGDGETQPEFEGCDDGVNDGSYGNCALGCLALAQHCGDGNIQSRFEQCDDGNSENSDGCNIDCVASGTLIWSRTIDGRKEFGDEYVRGAAMSLDGLPLFGGTSEVPGTSYTSVGWALELTTSGDTSWDFKSPSIDTQGSDIFGLVPWNSAILAVGRHSPSYSSYSSGRWILAEDGKLETELISSNWGQFSSIAAFEDGAYVVCAAPDPEASQLAEVTIAFDASHGETAFDSHEEIWCTGLAVADEASLYRVGHYNSNGGAYADRFAVQRLAKDTGLIWTRTDIGVLGFAWAVAVTSEGWAAVASDVGTDPPDYYGRVAVYDDQGSLVWEHTEDLESGWRGIGVAGDDTIVVTGEIGFRPHVRKYSGSGELLWEHADLDLEAGISSVSAMTVGSDGTTYLASSVDLDTGPAAWFGAISP